MTIKCFPITSTIKEYAELLNLPPLRVANLAGLWATKNPNKLDPTLEDIKLEYEANKEKMTEIQFAVPEYTIKEGLGVLALYDNNTKSISLPLVLDKITVDSYIDKIHTVEFLPKQTKLLLQEVFFSKRSVYNFMLWTAMHLALGLEFKQAIEMAYRKTEEWAKVYKPTITEQSTNTSALQQSTTAEQEDDFSNIDFDALSTPKNTSSTNLPVAVFKLTTELKEEAQLELPMVGTIQPPTDSPFVAITRDMNSTTRSHRVQMLASIFSKCVEKGRKAKIKELQEIISTTQDEKVRRRATRLLSEIMNSADGKKKYITRTPLTSIFLDVKKVIELYANDAKETDYRKLQYQLVLKHFDILMKEACSTIEFKEGIRIIPIMVSKNNGTSTQLVLGGLTSETVYEEDNNSKQNDDNENGEADKSSGTEWSARVKELDHRLTLSQAVKKVISEIPVHDKAGNIDDLGWQLYLNSEVVYATLLNELSWMTNSDDFYNKEGKTLEEKFPALSLLKNKYPWVIQIMRKLNNDKSLISLFYSNFRLSFTRYGKIGQEGNLMYLNDPVALDSMMTRLKRHIDHGIVLEKTSIYDTKGNVNTAKQDDLILIKNKIVNTLQQIRDDEELDNFNKDNEKKKALLKNITLLIRSLGIEVSNVGIDALLKSIEDKEKLEHVIDRAYLIISKLGEVNEQHIVTYFNGFYTSIALILGEVTEADNTSTFREGGKDYPSYSPPNYIDTLISSLKHSEKRQLLLAKYKKDKFFYENGKWKNKWLEEIENNPTEITRQLEVMYMKHIENDDYANWSPTQLAEGLLLTYANSSTVGKGYAYFHLPLFSDSEVAAFFRFKTYEGLGYESIIVNKLYEVVQQELYRMSLVQERSKNGVQEIANYDGKRGRQFCFMPALNNYKVNGVTLLLALEKHKNNLQGREAELLIKQAITDVLSTEFDLYILDNLPSESLVSKLEKATGKSIQTTKKDDAGNTINKTKNEINAELQDLIREWQKKYFYNLYYASSQIIQLTVKDPAFYKNDVDFQKRFKQVYAAGKKLNTNSLYGRKKERTIYLADFIMTSNSYTSLKTMLFNAVKEGRLQKRDAEFILSKYRNINATDAQAYRTISSYRAVLDMQGLWTQEMETALDRFELGTWNMSDFNIVWQSIKPFVYSITEKPDGLGGTMLVGHQNKNSEFLLLAVLRTMMEGINAPIGLTLRKSPLITGLNKFMERNEIDVAQFESSVKTGCLGTINLNYSRRALNKLVQSEAWSSILEDAKKLEEYKDTLSDFDKYKLAYDYRLDNEIITQELYINAMDEIAIKDEDEVIAILDEAVKVKEGLNIEGQEPYKFNPEIVHEIDYDDYVVLLPTPEHLIDHESIVGSQFRNLIISDLPSGFSITIGGKLYDRLELMRLYDSIHVENLLDSYEKVSKIFGSIEELQKELLNMVQGNPKYGRSFIDALELVPHPTDSSKKVFNIPTIIPSMRHTMLELMLSVFKNRITKQYIKGGNAIMCSNFGLTKELSVLRNSDGTIKGAEIYLPASSKKFYSKFIDEKTGELKIDELPEDLRLLIGYRIPTEGKYSMMPLIVKGFLPLLNGSSIMLPADITTIAGSDFDVDKMFLMIPEFEFVGPNKKLQKVLYDHNKPIELNTLAQRNNLMIDIAFGILTSPEMALKVSSPGNYDNIKLGARKARVINNSNMINTYIGGESGKEIAERLDSAVDRLILAELNEMEEFVNSNTNQKSWLNPSTYIYFHTQNMAGAKLIGIYANGTTGLAKFLTSALSIPESKLFAVNGLTVTSVSKIKALDGLTDISLNCAECSAASVDNAKDPVLADLALNPNTASVFNTMLRMGMSILTSCLLFSHPIIRELALTGKLTTGQLYKLLSIISNRKDTELLEHYKHLHKNLIGKNKNQEIITDSYIAKSAIEVGNGALRQDKNYYNNSIVPKAENVIVLMMHIVRISESVNSLTLASRADSPNGSLSNSLAKGRLQLQQVQLIRNASKSEHYPLKGITGSWINLGPLFITNNMTRDLLRAKLMSSSMRRLQAFYSLGVDLPMNLVSLYFPLTNPKLDIYIQDIFNNSAFGTLSKSTLERIYKEWSTFLLTKTLLLGDTKDMTMNQKKEAFLKTFPRLVSKIKLGNSSLNNLAVVQKLQVTDEGVLLDRSARLSSNQKERLIQEIDSLLNHEDPQAQKLAMGLLLYSFYTDLLNFGPNSFGNLLSPTFYNAFSGFLPEVRQLNDSIGDTDTIRFYDFIVRKYGVLIFPNIDTIGEPLDFNENEGFQMEAKQVRNINLNGTASYKYLVVEVPDKTSFFGTTLKLYELDEADSSQEYKVYRHKETLPLNTMPNANKSGLELVEEQSTQLKQESNSVIELTSLDNLLLHLIPSPATLTLTTVSQEEFEDIDIDEDEFSGIDFDYDYDRFDIAESIGDLYSADEGNNQLKEPMCRR